VNRTPPRAVVMSGGADSPTGERISEEGRPVAISTARPAAGRWATGIAVLGLAVPALTGCGGEEPSASPPSSSAPATGSSAPAEPGPVGVTAVDYSLELEHLTFRAGSYEIEFSNDGSSLHNLVVARDGQPVAQTDGEVSPGGSDTFTVQLDPGQYVFFCAVANHRSMGMEVTVEVSA
jgi:plastocyanin